MGITPSLVGITPNLSAASYTVPPAPPMSAHCDASNTLLTMLRYALIFFIVALIAALFGFTGIAAGAAEIAKILFFIFLVVAGVALIMGLVRRGP